MKRTAFLAIHRRLGAKIVEFAGFEMPVLYTSIIDEHKAVRTSVGVFDVSHMGEFEISGKDALTLVQKVTINNAARLSPGKVQYSAMCYPNGGIVDDLLVYRIADDRFMLVVNASNTSKDFDWIKSNIGSLEVRLSDNSDAISLLAIQGPNSLKTLQKLTDADLLSLQYYTFTHGKIAGVDALISRTGYTGELGFEIYFDASPLSGEKVWNAVMDAGNKFDIKPIGLGARDTLRLEMGFCLYGNDIDQTTNPLEAGLGWITKLDKGDFVGRDVLLNVQHEGLTRKLVGFTLDDRKAFPRHGYEIRANGSMRGHVTSGTISPILDKGIGMGYVPLSMSQPGCTMNVLIRNKEVGAHVVKLPFISR